ncbi:MAG TPA: GAF and ANTAR domain-containing protein [Nocardioides sp.]|nr:GAF and ANTAR domain-containing protein [Nocardioides sp.]
MPASVSFDEAAEAFGGLAEVLYRSDSYTDVYEQLCRTAVELIPGCDRACIVTLSAGREPRLEAATDEIAARVDRMEWECGEGPCVDAILSERFECDPDITQHPAWPNLAARVLRETPVRGMVGYRIVMGGRKVGALNIFSDRKGALTPGDADAGAVLAAFASVAITAASQKAEARSLRDGLASNREIGKAVGLLMATHAIGDEEAFEVLRQASTGLNRRLADIARQIVEDHNTRAGGSAG